MENITKSHSRHTLNYGLITGGVLIVFSLLLYALDLWSNRWLAFLSYLILLVMMYLGTKAFRDNLQGGFISFGKGFNVAFMIGLFAAIVLVIYNYLFFKFFDPSAVEKMMEMAEEQMRTRQPDISEDDLETAMGFANKFMTPAAISVMGLIYNIIASLILGLLVAAGVRKDAPFMPESQQETTSEQL
jgi:ethanolamine transporter EutH